MKQPTPPKVHKTKDGRVLCGGHAHSGAPLYHTEGCEECAKARAKGIMRPNAGDISPRRRGAAGYYARFVDWGKIKAARARNGG